MTDAKKIANILALSEGGLRSLVKHLLKQLNSSQLQDVFEAALELKFQPTEE